MTTAKNSAGTPGFMKRWAARATLTGPLPVGSEAQRDLQWPAAAIRTQEKIYVHGH